MGGNRGMKAGIAEDIAGACHHGWVGAALSTETALSLILPGGGCLPHHLAGQGNAYWASQQQQQQRWSAFGGLLYRGWTGRGRGGESRSTLFVLGVPPLEEFEREKQKGQDEGGRVLHHMPDLVHRPQQGCRSPCGRSLDAPRPPPLRFLRHLDLPALTQCALGWWVIRRGPGGRAVSSSVRRCT